MLHVGKGSVNAAMPLESELYDTDEFRMYCFKVLPCSKRYSHDWTTCPFAHPGEKAKRRDPRVCQYTAIACPEMKKDLACPRGKNCPYSHNDFEYWLHPSRYRTQLCNDGTNCRRKVCFFAHQAVELRVPTYKPVLPDASVDAASGPAPDVHLAIPQQAGRSSLEQPRGSANSPAAYGGTVITPLPMHLALDGAACETPAQLHEMNAPNNFSAILSSRSSSPPQGAPPSLEHLTQNMTSLSLGSAGIDQPAAAAIQGVMRNTCSPISVRSSPHVSIPASAGTFAAAALFQMQQQTSRGFQQFPYRHSSINPSVSRLHQSIPEGASLVKHQLLSPALAYQSSLYAPASPGIQLSALNTNAAPDGGANYRRHSLDSTTSLMAEQLLLRQGNSHIRRSFDVHHPHASLQMLQLLSPYQQQDTGDSSSSLSYSYGLPEQQAMDVLQQLHFSPHQPHCDPEQLLQSLGSGSQGSSPRSHLTFPDVLTADTANSMEVYQLLSCMQQQQRQQQ